MIEEGVRVASFALAPSAELIAELKEAGVVVIPSIGARRHAEKVAAWGADAVIVQGGEGGGHTGEVATTVLLPQVVDAVWTSRSWRRAASSTAGVWSRRWPTARRASPWAPASSSPRTRRSPTR